VTPRNAPDGRIAPARPVAAMLRSPNGAPATPLPVNARESLRAVLAGLRLPARRWQVIAEGDAWGVSGTLRRALNLLPEYDYPTLDSIVDVLMHGCVLNGRPPGGPPMARPSGMPVRSATESPAA